MNMTLHICSFCLWTILTNTHAEPFIPKQEQQVLERLPESLFQSATRAKTRTLKSQLDNQPNDWSAASQLAKHYINLSQRQADPRYMGYAQATLKLWWNSPRPPLQILLLRAVILQNAHNFKAANRDLDLVLKMQPGHVQANLIKATIATVQGNYPSAIQHCQQLIRRSSMLQALICQHTSASLSGQAESSYRVLHQLLSVDPSLPKKETSWAWTTLAENAWRLGYFEAADSHFKTAIQTGAHDFYLFRVYADFLLQQHRPFEVIKLIKLIDPLTQNDSLLLRLAIAEKTVNSRQLHAHLAVLTARINANRRRGSSLHLGDEARFELYLLNNPQSALQLARQNWQLQRESADTYILLQSAIAADDSVTLEQVTNWLKQQGTKDVVIRKILAGYQGKYHEG